MAGLGEPVPLHAVDRPEIRLHHLILRLVVPAVEQQRRRLDPVEFRPDIPRLERARDAEFRRAVPEKGFWNQPSALTPRVGKSNTADKSKTYMVA